MTTHLIRTDSENPAFLSLVRLLDADLAGRDGSEHAFYAQFNKVDKLKHVIVLLEGESAVACGAMKAITGDTVEIKRMYTISDKRGQGMASLILSALESWAKELSFTKAVLETGKRQPEAIALYRKNGYQIIPNYGQYVGVENSVCFEKEIVR